MGAISNSAKKVQTCYPFKEEAQTVVFKTQFVPHSKHFSSRL